jgi:hypothetical protein
MHSKIQDRNETKSVGLAFFKIIDLLISNREIYNNDMIINIYQFPTSLDTYQIKQSDIKNWDSEIISFDV